MTISEHMLDFVGKPVQDWEPGDTLDPTKIPRIRMSYEESDQGQHWTDKLDALLQDPAAGELYGIVAGAWDGMYEGEAGAEPVVQALVAARDRLPQLRAIFLGDITFEESEISWLQQTDVSPLLAAYPELEHFGVRGSQGLSLGALRHERLQSLIVQSGGLPRAIVHEINAARLPELTYLEVWLGTEDYGGDVTIEDLQPILAGALFPKLTYLGLRDSMIADQVAAAVAQAPVLERIEVLDLSLGTLGDEGAAALLQSPHTKELKKLNIYHHYCTPAMVEKLEQLGIEVDADEGEEPDEYDGELHRYVAVGE